MVKSRSIIFLDIIISEDISFMPCLLLNDIGGVIASALVTSEVESEFEAGWSKPKTIELVLAGPALQSYSHILCAYKRYLRNILNICINVKF